MINIFVDNFPEFDKWDKAMEIPEPKPEFELLNESITEPFECSNPECRSTHPFTDEDGCCLTCGADYILRSEDAL